MVLKKSTKKKVYVLTKNPAASTHSSMIFQEVLVVCMMWTGRSTWVTIGWASGTSLKWRKWQRPRNGECLWSLSKWKRVISPAVAGDHILTVPHKSETTRAHMCNEQINVDSPWSQFAKGCVSPAHDPHAWVISRLKKIAICFCLFLDLESPLFCHTTPSKTWNQVNTTLNTLVNFKASEFTLTVSARTHIDTKRNTHKRKNEDIKNETHCWARAEPETRSVLWLFG